MAIVWPPGLPAFPLRDGFGLKLPKQVVSTPTDRGRPLVRRKTAARSESMPMTLDMTEAQKDLFVEFYYDTTAGGVLTFEYHSPAHGNQAITFMFHPDASPPGINMAGARWLAQFTLLRIA